MHLYTVPPQQQTMALRLYDITMRFALNIELNIKGMTEQTELQIHFQLRAARIHDQHSLLH